MNITAMHVAIDQGLSLGRFTNRDASPEEKDIAINAETLKLLDDVFRERPQQPADFEENIFSAEITRLYKTDAELACVDFGTYGETESIPQELHHLLATKAVVYSKLNVNKLEANTSYEVVEPTKYGVKWYKRGERFTSTDDLFYFGRVCKLIKKYQDVRLVSSEHINKLLSSHYQRTRIDSVVTELFGNKLRAYQQGFIVDGMSITYSKLPVKVSFANRVDSDLPENIQQWLIDKVIMRIANNNNTDQQKIQNLKQEIL